MSVALRLYEQLTDAGEDKTRAKLIAEAFEQLENRYPQLHDVATGAQLSETELRLQKEIKETEARAQKELEQIRLQIRETESRTQKELEQIRLQIREVEANLRKDLREVEANLQKDMRDVEASLRKELKELDLKIHQTQVRVAESETRLVGMMHRQLYWVIGSVGTVIAFIRLLDWLLAGLSK
jgi:chromosome segregation ATPase